jgi:glycosyltransferase involved in cell wall biosynthesis
VLFVNPPIDHRRAKQNPDHPYVARRIRVAEGIEDSVVHVADRVWALYPPVVVRSLRGIQNHWVFDAFNYWNNYLLAKYIQRSCRKLHFDHYILVNAGEIFRSYYLSRLLNAVLFVYYLQNNQIIYAQKRWHGIRLEPKLIAKADLVVVGSLPLSQVAKEINQNTHFVGQGYEGRQFASTRTFTVPPDMENLPRPIIGYFGSLRASRIDYKLLLKIARARPEWTFVLIGPEDEILATSELHILPNVFFPGNKDVSELPLYLNTFDVAIDPMHRDSAHKVHYPRKVDEYLALGKPVVATKSPASAYFADYIHLADRSADFIAKIALALAGEDTDIRKQRIAFAQTHSWEKIGQKILKLIQESLYRKYTTK